MFTRSIQSANSKVYEAGHGSMATTLVACTLRFDRATVAHVGEYEHPSTGAGVLRIRGNGVSEIVFVVWAHKTAIAGLGELNFQHRKYGFRIGSVLNRGTLVAPPHNRTSQWKLYDAGGLVGPPARLIRYRVTAHPPQSSRGW
jgi:hypothetical protein